MLSALDLYCGLGGWSDGLALEGFDCLGVDIDPRVRQYYRHPLIIADIHTLDGHRFTGYDLIVGSPPAGERRAEKFRRFVADAQPRYWLM